MEGATSGILCPVWALLLSSASSSESLCSLHLAPLTEQGAASGLSRTDTEWEGKEIQQKQTHGTASEKLE